MDINKLKAILSIDEGCERTVYLDTLGNKTVGIGHEVQPEDNLNLGDTITQTQCDNFFATDINKAINACIKSPVIPYITQPEAIQESLVDMYFNMGSNLTGFTTFLSLIKAGNYSAAADDLKGTLWAKQVGSRAVRIEAAIRSCASCVGTN